MADLPVQEETNRKPIIFQSNEILSAGQKLTDIPELLALAQKTVPSGKWAVVYIQIKAIIVDNDPNPQE